MKKTFVMLVALMGLAAQAEDNNGVGPAWTCHIKGRLAGKSVGLIISGSQLEGRGVISCQSLNGVKTEVPVKMQIGGIGLGLGYTEYAEVEVATAAIGLASGPEALTGTFAIGPSAGLTLIEAGFDVGLALRMSQVGGLSFELAFLGRQSQGLEAKLQLQTFSIERAN